ncbi:MAG: ferrous iron transport protein B [Desulfovibrionaceae bacterium]
MERAIHIALAGNPNSGKTTMFNALTGARQHVGNYPGVTVTRKEGVLRHGGANITVVDLPGTYSLTPYSEEEIAARDYIVNDRPDAVVDILDANTLERGLYLAVQFLELGLPLVLALNMMDEVQRKGRRIDSKRLAELLDVPVVETVAREGQGKDELTRQAVAHARQAQGRRAPLLLSYGSDVDHALLGMEDAVGKSGVLTHLPPRWVALKFLEDDPTIRETVKRRDAALFQSLSETAARTALHVRQTLNTGLDALVADHRYGYIASLLKQGVIVEDSDPRRRRISDRVDKVLTHALAGPLLMMGVLWGMFHLTFWLGELPLGWMDALFGWLSGVAEAAIPEGMLQSLVVSGIIDGVGGVLGFVPLVLFLFLQLAILEDLGYTARMAYMLDRVFKAFGLHGNSVMPFIIGGGIPGGCAVPAVMAARTLKSPKEKLATVLTTPFMACGAKVPVFLLLIAAFFPAAGASAMFWITLGSWAAALLVAKLLRITAIKGEATPFLMELPPYRLPTLRGVLIHTWERCWQYIKKAGTVILGISILLWAALTFPGLSEERTAGFEAQREAAQVQYQGEPEALDAAVLAIDNQEAEEALRGSFAGRLGVALEPLSELAGFDWRTNIALIGGFAAKEVVVSTLGTAYSLGDVDPEESTGLADRLRADPAFSLATALALMVFTVLYAPCFVTVVVIARESSWRWAAFSVVFNTALAFAAATVTYQIASAV